MIPDNLDINSPKINEISKVTPDKSTDKEKVSPEEAEVSKIGHSVLSENKEAVSTTAYDIQRTQIAPASEQEPDVSGLVKNAADNKEIAPRFNISIGKARKADAADKLFRENNISAGREKLLTNIHDFPNQLELDLKRLGTVTVGEITRPPSYFGKHEPETIYRYLSASLKGYIHEQNPNLRADGNKIEEILNSATQTTSNDLLDRRADNLPGMPWGPAAGAESTKKETSFKLEKTWFGKPEVLVVSQKLTKVYVNADDPDAPQKLLIMDARVKHNLKTNDVEFEYEMTIKNIGKWGNEYHEVWDPTKEHKDPKTGSWVPN